MLNGVTAAAERVKEGQSLAHSLETQNLFPDLAVEMLEVGESTGALPAMLASVAEFYEEDVQMALSAAMALIEPIILIFMAVFVGGISEWKTHRSPLEVGERNSGNLRTL